MEKEIESDSFEATTAPMIVPIGALWRTVKGPLLVKIGFRVSVLLLVLVAQAERKKKKARKAKGKIYL